MCVCLSVALAKCLVSRETQVQNSSIDAKPLISEAIEAEMLYLYQQKLC